MGRSRAAASYKWELLKLKLSSKGLGKRNADAAETCGWKTEATRSWNTKSVMSQGGKDYLGDSKHTFHMKAAMCATKSLFIMQLTYQTATSSCQWREDWQQANDLLLLSKCLSFAPASLCAVGGRQRCQAMFSCNYFILFLPILLTQHTRKAGTAAFVRPHTSKQYLLKL